MGDKQQEFEKYDFFRSDRFVNDPYAYFDYLRAQSPVLREPHHGIVMVTGYDEALEIYNDPDRFSSCMSTTGPFAGCPIPLQGHENEEFMWALADQQIDTFVSRGEASQCPSARSPSVTSRGHRHRDRPSRARRRECSRAAP